MNPRYERQLKKGVLEILVLQLLSKNKMYGYQLINELKSVSSELFTLKEGTLYPILYRLEDNKLVKSQWSQANDKEISKKYYIITDDGIKELEELKNLWSFFSKQVSKILEVTQDE